MEILNASTLNILAFLCLLLALYLRKIHDSYKFFKKRGLKNPPVVFLFGNLFAAYRNRRFIGTLKDWGLKYGKTYGYFEGHKPILVTSDVNLIQEVFSKQYSNFSARKRRPLDMPDDAAKVGLFTATETRWKNMRNIINPTFSTTKLRELNPSITTCVDRLCDVFEQNCDKSVDVRRVLKRFSMDSLHNCILGVDSDIQRDDRKLYIINKSDEWLEMLTVHSLAMYLPILFHEVQELFVPVYWKIQLFLLKLSQFTNIKLMNSIVWIRESSVNLVKSRLENPEKKRKDCLGLMIEAYTSNIDELQRIEKFDSETTKLKKKLSIEEIKMNLGIFITGGYDTVALTLSYCLFTMALLQEEQEKLRNEVDAHFPIGSDIEPNVDNVKQMKYMKCFISEVLRFHTVADQRCVHATILNGIDIPIGLTIQVNSAGLHRDPELWGPVDPDIFYPERFSVENKRYPFAFVGFGVGPRNCIAMNFAYAEMRIALVNLLRKFHFQATTNSHSRLNFSDFSVITKTCEINLLVKKHSSNN